MVSTRSRSHATPQKPPPDPPEEAEVATPRVSRRRKTAAEKNATPRQLPSSSRKKAVEDETLQGAKTPRRSSRKKKEVQPVATPRRRTRSARKIVLEPSDDESVMEPEEEQPTRSRPATRSSRSRTVDSSEDESELKPLEENSRPSRPVTRRSQNSAETPSGVSTRRGRRLAFLDSVEEGEVDREEELMRGPEALDGDEEGSEKQGQMEELAAESRAIFESETMEDSEEEASDEDENKSQPREDANDAEEDDLLREADIMQMEDSNTGVGESSSALQTDPEGQVDTVKINNVKKPDPEDEENGEWTEDLVLEEECDEDNDEEEEEILQESADVEIEKTVDIETKEDDDEHSELEAEVEHTEEKEISKDAPEALVVEEESSDEDLAEEEDLVEKDDEGEEELKENIEMEVDEDSREEPIETTENDQTASIHAVRKEKESSPRGIASVDDMLNVSDEQLSCFIRREQNVSMVCRSLMATCYENQTEAEYGSTADRKFVRSKRKGKPTMGPLPRLDVSEVFGSDQLWEEFELRNKGLLGYIGRRLKTIKKDTEREGGRDSDLAEKRGKDEGPRDANGVNGVAISGEDDVGKHKSKRPINKGRESAEDGDGVMATEDSETENDKGSGKRKKRKLDDKKVRFDLQSAGTDASKSEEKDLVERIEDGFFNIADMENFAGEAENLALEGKLVGSDDDEGGAEEDSDDPEDEAEVKPSKKLDEYHYRDFFDPPSKLREGSLAQKAARATRVMDGENEDSEIKENDSDEEVIETPLERKRAKQRKLIEAYEDESVKRKSWALRGEVSAFARPKDSLLDTEMEHEMTGKPREFMSSDVNKSIEDLIKQRVLDGLFDDVVPTLPEELKKKREAKRKDNIPDVSQEKPAEGLADLYAREYMEQKERVNKDKLASSEEQRDEEEVTPEQREVNRLFDKLSKTLDALSSLHFTPLESEAKVEKASSNAKALASEEAIPEAVSDGAVLAPREVYSVKEEKSSKEMSKQERRRKRKRRKEKSAASKRREVVVTDPLLAEKRKAEAALQRRGKKIKTSAPSMGAPASIDAVLRADRQGKQMQPAASSQKRLSAAALRA